MLSLYIIARSLLRVLRRVLYTYCVSSAGVFFFFKQKTAYEMRISDWSSDVCSSDLAQPDIGEEVPARGRDRRGPPIRALGHEIGRVGAIHHNIGRASCRERVCQYV